MHCLLGFSLPLILPLLILIFSHPQLSQAKLICDPTIPDAPPTPPSDPTLPLVHDCNYLFRVMFAAIMKYGDPPVMYGKYLADTTTTMGTPRHWELDPLPDEPRNTCAILVNNTSLDPLAQEALFKIEMVHTGQQVLKTCVKDRGEVGYDFPGQIGRILVGLTRSAGPSFGVVGGGGEGGGVGEVERRGVTRLEVEVEEDGGGKVNRTLVAFPVLGGDGGGGAGKMTVLRKEKKKRRRRLVVEDGKVERVG